MINSITGNPRIKFGVYLLLGFLTAVMVVLSLVQLWVLYSTQNVDAYGIIVPDERGLPRDDQRGAFLVLNDQRSAVYPSTLVQLLAVTSPGVIDEETGAHLLPSDLKYVLIQSAALNEPDDYRLDRIGDPEPGEMQVNKMPNGKDLTISPKTGVWKPGAYIVDMPLDGMDGGRTYFQFYIDEK